MAAGVDRGLALMSAVLAVVIPSSASATLSSIPGTGAWVAGGGDVGTRGTMEYRVGASVSHGDDSGWQRRQRQGRELEGWNRKWLAINTTESWLY